MIWITINSLEFTNLIRNNCKGATRAGFDVFDLVIAEFDECISPIRVTFRFSVVIVEEKNLDEDMRNRFPAVTNSLNDSSLKFGASDNAQVSCKH